MLCSIYASYMTVLFFSLYRACIWSIVGTWPCRTEFVELSHLRVGVNVEVRARGIRAIERAHDEHVHELNWRSEWCLSGVANDMAICVAYMLWRRKVWWSDDGFEVRRGGFPFRDCRESFNFSGWPTNVIFDILSRKVVFSYSTPETFNHTTRNTALSTAMSDPLCGVCNAEPKKYKCPTCALP